MVFVGSAKETAEQIANRIESGGDGSRIVSGKESGSITNTRIIIIVCEILFVLFLLFIGYIIYKHNSAINISSKVVQILDAILYLIIALFMFYLLYSKGKYHPFGLDIPYYSVSLTTLQTTKILMGFMFLLILLYFVFNCIWLVKDDDINDFNLATYAFLLVASLTSLIPLFIIQYNYDNDNEKKTYLSLLTFLFALGSMIGGALMVWDPTFMTEYLYNTFNFSKDNKGNKPLNDYGHVFMWLSTLIMIVIIPIMIILVNGTSAKYSIYFLVIVNFFIFIFSFYLLVKTKKLFLTETDTKIITVTLVLLCIGIFALVVGTALTIKNARSVTGDMDMPIICTKLGICCIACAQFLIGYYLYLPYVTPPSTNE